MVKKRDEEIEEIRKIFHKSAQKNAMVEIIPLADLKLKEEQMTPA